jgi:hypothetical protein
VGTAPIADRSKLVHDEKSGTPRLAWVGKALSAIGCPVSAPRLGRLDALALTADDAASSVPAAPAHVVDAAAARVTSHTRTPKAPRTLSRPAATCSG